MKRSMIEWVDALLKRIRVLVDDEINSRLRRYLVAVRVHVLEFPRRVDVKQWKGKRPWKEGLSGKMQHHCRILAHRVEHHWPSCFSDSLTKDEDTLRFQAVEVCQ